jgi:hypothetical protein
MTDTLNGSTQHRRANGRDHVAECVCPLCGSELDQLRYHAILGRQRATALEIEKATEAKFAKRLADAQKTKRAEIVAAVKVATQAVEAKLKETRDHHEATITARLAVQRETHEKAKAEAVAEVKAEAFKKEQVLEQRLQDLTRQIQSKTPFQRSEPAETSLMEAVAAVLPPTDVVRRIGKGQPGVDVVIEVVYGEGVIGKIVLDSKDHRRWQHGFTRKLRADQIAADADFAILSSSVFPKGASQLHVQDDCIIASPERVPTLVTILRRVILDNHIEKRSDEAKDRKAGALYQFLLSRRARDLFGKLLATGQELESLDAVEVKNHRVVWDKRAGLIRGLVEVHDTITSTVTTIINGEQQ